MGCNDATAARAHRHLLSWLGFRLKFNLSLASESTYRLFLTSTGTRKSTEHWNIPDSRGGHRWQSYSHRWHFVPCQQDAKDKQNVSPAVPMFEPVPPDYSYPIIGCIPRPVSLYPSNISSHPRNSPSRPHSFTFRLFICLRCITKSLRLCTRTRYTHLTRSTYSAPTGSGKKIAAEFAFQEGRLLENMQGLVCTWKGWYQSLYQHHIVHRLFSNQGQFRFWLCPRCIIS